MILLLLWLLWLVFLGFALRRLMTYLHIYQQDDYDASRFLPWLIRSAAFDKKASLGLLLCALMPLSIGHLGAILGLGVIAGREANPCHSAKKPLVLTARAKRVLGLAWGLAAVFSFCAFVALRAPFWGWILAVQALPLLLPLANLLLKPVEAWVQHRYWTAAQARLRTVNPTVIGVTGSFGKTSVKQMLGHVLQTHARTCFAKGSINTPMGTSRFLSTELAPDCRYYIGEMGAYQRGSIARLCRLTPPHHGVITALGEAHYERFKSLETVARAKFELAEAVLAQKGKMVIAEQALTQIWAREFVAQHRESFLVCGDSASADLRILEATQRMEGTQVTLGWQGQTYCLTAPVWGAHQAGNIALVFALCVGVLGISPLQVEIALKTVPQTRHRLEVKHQQDGTIYLDDAFNSNLTGFISALEVLSLLCPAGGRRILVTPGMAELGAAHDAQHALVAEKAASCVDIALVVQPERIPSFVQGLSCKLGETLLTFPTFAAARLWMQSHVKAGDCVLIENDLPDLYEKKLNL